MPVRKPTRFKPEHLEDDTPFSREVVVTMQKRRIPSIESVCSNCVGHGVAVYGSTATWRGGIGGQAMTADVCDKCWGSGNIDRPWPSHRDFERLKRAAKAEGAGS